MKREKLLNALEKARKLLDKEESRQIEESIDEMGHFSVSYGLTVAVTILSRLMSEIGEETAKQAIADAKKG